MSNLTRFIEGMPLELFVKMTTFKTIDDGFYDYRPQDGIDSPANRYKYFTYLVTKTDFIKGWN